LYTCKSNHMKKTLTITDLTQMPTWDRVCVAGIDELNQCIRPITEDTSGIPKDYLSIGGVLVIQPRAKVSFDLREVCCQPPHIEDRGFDPNSVISKGLCDDAEWERILRASSYTKVDDIFEGFVRDRKWVEPGAKTRSLGTLSDIMAARVQLPEWDGKLRYRLSFKDNGGLLFDYPVSDLTFRELCYTEVKRKGQARSTVSSKLTDLLQSADRTYLRLGLARPFPVSDELRCYIQVTGIYTFPDYLGHKTFASFLSQ